MSSAQDSILSDPGLNTGWGHCAMSCGKRSLITLIYSVLDYPGLMTMNEHDLIM